MCAESKQFNENLAAECLEHNRKLLEGLVQHEHHDELFRLTCKDAELGRMSKPVPVQQLDLASVRLHPRFAVEQGMTKTGKRKIRAVDHFSWSCHGSSRKKRKHASVNGQCLSEEKLEHDHLDVLMVAIKQFIR